MELTGWYLNILHNNTLFQKLDEGVEYIESNGYNQSNHLFFLMTTMEMLIVDVSLLSLFMLVR